MLQQTNLTPDWSGISEGYSVAIKEAFLEANRMNIVNSTINPKRNHKFELYNLKIILLFLIYYSESIGVDIKNINLSMTIGFSADTLKDESIILETFSINDIRDVLESELSFKQINQSKSYAKEFFKNFTKEQKQGFVEGYLYLHEADNGEMILVNWNYGNGSKRIIND